MKNEERLQYKQVTGLCALILRVLARECYSGKAQKYLCEIVWNVYFWSIFNKCNKNRFISSVLVLTSYYWEYDFFLKTAVETVELFQFIEWNTLVYET